MTVGNDKIRVVVKDTAVHVICWWISVYLLQCVVPRVEQVLPAPTMSVYGIRLEIYASPLMRAVIASRRSPFHEEQIAGCGVVT